MASPVNLDFATSDAQKVVLIIMVVIMVAVTVEKLAGAKGVTTSYVHLWIAGIIALMLLEGLSYVLPEFAVGLAFTAMITVLLTQGEPFWSAISKVTGSSKPAISSSTPTTPTNPLGQIATSTTSTSTGHNVVTTQ
jgi:hypothetical protein